MRARRIQGQQLAANRCHLTRLSESAFNDCCRAMHSEVIGVQKIRDYIRFSCASRIGESKLSGFHGGKVSRPDT